MASKWKATKVSDLLSIKHGFAFKGEYFTDEETEYQLTTPGNFSISGGFQDIKPKYYDGPIPSDYVLSPGQIIVTMTDLSKKSDTLGFAAVIPNDEKTWLHNQRVGLIQIHDLEVCNPVFINYLFRTHEYRSWVIGSATGTTVKHTSPSRITSYEFLLPPLSEQKAIAHILGTLDDKIELNRQMNETLEAMAQALFKSWFVDFDPVIDNALLAGKAIPEPLKERAEMRQAQLDSGKAKTNSEINDLFPSGLEFTEELGWIPKGWSIKTLSDVTSEIIDHRGKTPKKLGGDWVEDGYPAISAKNIKDNKLIRPDTIRFIDEDMYKRWMKIPLEKGDVLMTSEAPLGELYYLNSGKEYVLSQRLYGIRANNIDCSGAYLFYWLQTNTGSASLQNRATGTTVIGIKQSELRKVEVLCPTGAILEKFNSYSLAILEKMDANDSSNITLANLRDTLLPKLMSGELRIPDAEKLVEDI